MERNTQMPLVDDKYVLNRLRYLCAKFAEVDIETKVLEKQHVLDMSTLQIFTANDGTNRRNVISLAYLLNYSDDETKVLLLQFFTEIPIEFEATQIPLFETLVSFINTRMPLGHFGIQNNKVYYRYVMFDSKNAYDHAVQTIETFLTYECILNHFHQAIESVIQGNMTLDTFKSTF